MTEITDLKRIDFEVGLKLANGKFAEGYTEKITIIYNIKVISEKEVNDLIDSGMYEYDDRIVVTTTERADNLKTPVE